MCRHPLSAVPANEYMAISMTKSNKGWHVQWFYVKNDDTPPPPSPIFSKRTIEETPPGWGWGPIEREKKRLSDLLAATLEEPRPLRSRRHRGVPRKEGGATDGACLSALRDGACRVARQHIARRGGAP
ncbi:hypothetical protein PVAP13_2KG109380 [Panicum virgatum]|uniref:Uncharacterized protein n=1 Tax=Panicum virgatum TaxID=38727 RepID=A0A8T0VZH3_PANVG|nr:hypothetical protein PVAP13_2KG109380 [Panicum virgatum]